MYFRYRGRHMQRVQEEMRFNNTDSEDDNLYVADYFDEDTDIIVNDSDE